MTAIDEVDPKQEAMAAMLNTFKVRYDESLHSS